jgi:Kef-type K+ transport system membrane component KefB
VAAGNVLLTTLSINPIPLLICGICVYIISIGIAFGLILMKLNMLSKENGNINLNKTTDQRLYE